MTRHIVDKGHAAADEAGRTRAYTKIERDVKPTEQAKKAQKASPERHKNARLKAYTRIERDAG